MDLSELTQDEFLRFCELIYRKAGIRIADTKRVMVSNRVRRRLRATGIDTFARYYDHLHSPAGRGEMQAFLDAVTTNETYFFRDPAHYEWFGRRFLPEKLADAAGHRRPRSLRIWSAACSTGEAPYALSIEVAAHRAALNGWKVDILGTDLSTSALAIAAAGSYDARSLRSIDPARLQSSFDETSPGRFRIKPELRRSVAFRSHNLLEPLPDPAPFDCVFLKNVMIYFDPASKRRAVGHVVGSLAAGGYLVIGPTEGVQSLLTGLERIQTWLYRKAA